VFLVSRLDASSCYALFSIIEKVDRDKNEIGDSQHINFSLIALPSIIQNKIWKKL